jgi:hypothetical protein
LRFEIFGCVRRAKSGVGNMDRLGNLVLLSLVAACAAGGVASAGGTDDDGSSSGSFMSAHLDAVIAIAAVVVLLSAMVCFIRRATSSACGGCAGARGSLRLSECSEHGDDDGAGRLSDGLMGGSSVVSKAQTLDPSFLDALFTAWGEGGAGTGGGRPSSVGIPMQ